MNRTIFRAVPKDAPADTCRYTLTEKGQEAVNAPAQWPHNVSAPYAPGRPNPAPCVKCGVLPGLHSALCVRCEDVAIQARQELDAAPESLHFAEPPEGKEAAPAPFVRVPEPQEEAAL